MKFASVLRYDLIFHENIARQLFIQTQQTIKRVLQTQILLGELIDQNLNRLWTAFGQLLIDSSH